MKNKYIVTFITDDIHQFKSTKAEFRIAALVKLEGVKLEGKNRSNIIKYFCSETSDALNKYYDSL